MATIEGAGTFGFDFPRFYREDFNFNDYKPPFYKFEEVCLGIAGYLLAIRLTTFLMRFKKTGFNLKYISALHNLFLFLISVSMLVGILMNVVDLYLKGGQEAILCNATGTYRSNLANFWYYIFYLTKPYEFVDTFIMIFKKRELNFLHVWHHCTTFVLVWVTMVRNSNFIIFLIISFTVKYSTNSSILVLIFCRFKR